MPVLSQYFSIIIDRSISAPGHGKDVVNGLNAICKRYIYQLMSNVQLTESNTFDSQIPMHSCTKTNYVSMAKQPQNHLSKEYS